ncbi:MAG: N-acetylmuramic acid 6-phosphate etherase [Actinobacteria bacterium]|nr:N-acetylmuramic acid 6-phosphate etherase [Actinomycetota bacterium]
MTGRAKFAHLLTESTRADLADIDLRPTLELVRLMNEEDARVPAAVAEVARPLADAIDAIGARVEDGGRLIYLGAGTAGRIGVLDAAECGPTFNAHPGQVIGVLAGGNDAATQASETEEDDYEAGAGDLRALEVSALDSVVGVSASGRTPYVLGGIELARARGALTIGVSCNPAARLSELVEHPIEVVVGPEFIAGSTRLKAGTAQKLVLNTISTLVMVRLGKTYGNLMIDVRATNEKLRARARSILAVASGRPADAIDAALAASGDDVKAALVMLVRDVDAAEARRRLEAGEGRVRTALADGPCG